jgi:hypothetical protein
MHIGERSWESFTELERTLNLLKKSDGPVLLYSFIINHMNIRCEDTLKELDQRKLHLVWLSNSELFLLKSHLH